MKIPINEVYVDNSFNCRLQQVTVQTLRSLIRSIETQGLLQPVVVAPYEGEYKYQLICGFRRFTACKHLGWEEIPATVTEKITQNELRTLNLIENLERKDLNFQEEAYNVDRMRLMGYNLEEIAEQLNRTPWWVKQRLQFSEFPKDIQKEWIELDLPANKISEVHRLRTEDERYEAFRKLKDAKFAQKPMSKVRLKGKKKKKLDTCKVRDTSEIEDMMELVMDAFGGAGLATRLLAWAMGRVPDRVILSEIKESCKRMGVAWEIPADVYDVNSKADVYTDV